MIFLNLQESLFHQIIKINKINKIFNKDSNKNDWNRKPNNFKIYYKKRLYLKISFNQKNDYFNMMRDLILNGEEWKILVSQSWTNELLLILLDLDELINLKHQFLVEIETVWLAMVKAMPILNKKVMMVLYLIYIRT